MSKAGMNNRDAQIVITVYLTEQLNRFAMSMYNIFNRNICRTTGLALAVAMMSFAAGCSDDKPSNPPSLADSVTYAGTQLMLSYNGEQMPGKSVTLTLEPHSDGAQSIAGEMTMYSEFDLSELKGMGLKGSVPGPGVIPGSPSLTFPVTLTLSGGNYVFSGEGLTEHATFKYSGSAESKTLKLDMEAALRNQVLAGEVLAPAPLEKVGVLEYKSMPFHLVWEIDPALGVKVPLSEILEAMAVAPVIPVYDNTAYTSVAQMFVSGVKTLALTPGGNIPIVYISTTGGAARVATTCGNMLQYVPDPGGLKLYVNPLTALGKVLVAFSKPSSEAHFSTKSGSDGLVSGLDPEVVTALVQALAATAAPQLSQGMPLTVAPTDAGADIYFDTKTSVTFLATLLQNVMKNPEIMQGINSYLASIDLPGLKPEEIAEVMQKLPQFLEHTTRLEIGLSLVKAK